MLSWLADKALILSWLLAMGLPEDQRTAVIEACQHGYETGEQYMVEGALLVACYLGAPGCDVVHHSNQIALATGDRAILLTRAWPG